MNKIILVGLILTSLVSCAHKQPNSQEHLLASTLWVQNAGEAKALYLQAYNIARLRLDQDLEQNKSPLKRAVVVDADETVVDNSPYQARNYLKGSGFTKESWTKWCNEASAKATPGSLEFLKYAHEKGVTVFYITNRADDLKEGTYKNLKNLGFPIEYENLMMKTDSSSKKARRDRVLEDHRIVLLVGDNLIDFHEMFDHLSTEDRLKKVEDHQEKFGHQFIVLPNPMYGDWEKAIYLYDRKLTPEQQKNFRNAALKP